MPTIEIISIGATAIPTVPKLDKFSVCASVEVVSDRSLFVSDLLGVEGVIMHLGDSRNREKHLRSCGHSIDWSNCYEDELFQFEPSSYGEIQKLLSELLLASPERTVLFLTDIQMSIASKRVELGSLVEFDQLQFTSGIRWNTIYKISTSVRD